VLFAGDPQLPEVYLRREGWRQALQEAGVAPDAALELVVPFEAIGARAALDARCAAAIDFDAALDHARDRLKRFEDRADFVRLTSDEAADTIAPESLDFIYLDGNHHNPQFRRDLENWWPLLKPGGLFGGHDYYDRDIPVFRCEVRTTVIRWACENKLYPFKTTTSDPNDQSWWILKPIP
jgi:SAM-dependent methyltransferase